MNTIEGIREFFGWCCVINIVILLLAMIPLVLFRGLFSSIHAKMFNLDESDVSRGYFQFMAQYKIALLVLCIVPYIALCILS